MRAMLILALILGLSVVVTAQGARYVPQPVGRLMLNEVLPATVTDGTTLPLYLDKTGRYYAEILLEAPPDTAAVAEEVPLSFEFVFRRGDRVLHAETVAVVLAPGERGKTLFWLEAPAQLPARRDMQVTVRLATLPPSLAGHDLRLQLTRKFEMRPLAPL
jgi:hypothetical protein